MQEENKTEEIQKEEGGILGEGNELIIDNQAEGNAKLRLVALFVVAVLVGVVVKAQAVKTVTMGFDDYRVSEFNSDFDLTKEAKVEEQSSTQQEERAVPEVRAPSCGG